MKTGKRLSSPAALSAQQSTGSHFFTAFGYPIIAPVPAASRKPHCSGTVFFRFTAAWSAPEQPL